jgi:hypothetical protein
MLLIKCRTYGNPISNAQLNLLASDVKFQWPMRVLHDQRLDPEQSANKVLYTNNVTSIT